MATVKIRSLLAAVLVALVIASAAQAQPPVSVTAADPPQGEQNTVSLVVRITGKNFADGARVDFFQSGTSNPAGITVQSTRVTKSTEIEATIDIDAGAALSFFDIRVTNQSGRSGKGSDLFQVVQKGQLKGCVLQPLPGNVTLLASLNAVNTATGLPEYQGQLGGGFNTRPIAINGKAVLMLAAPAGPAIEVFYLSEGVSGGIEIDAVNPHRRLTAPGLPTLAPGVIADFNADGVPDIVARNAEVAKAVVFIGVREPSGHLNFGPAIPVPAPSFTEGFASSVRAGDLDATWDGDEIAVSQSPGRQGGTRYPGRIHLFRLGGSSVVPLPLGPITPTLSPALNQGDGYGDVFDVADVTGSGDADLIVSARYRAVGSTDWAGEVYVFFPGPTFDTDATTPGLQPHIIRAHTTREQFGAGLGTGDVNNDGTLDVLSATFYNSPVVAADVTLGAIGASQSTSASYAVEVPQGDPSMGFASGGLVAGDVDGDGLTDLAVGAPSATSGLLCDKPGALFLWRGTGQAAAPWQTPLVIQAPELDVDRAHFAYTVRIARLGDESFLIVGERWRDLGGVSQAGQIYLFRVSAP